MISERYRQALPPYWYENAVAEYHFEGAGGESDYQAETIQELGKQFLVPYATYGLDVWDWIYFGDTQLGSYEQRRTAIRKKNLAKARFTIATLKTMGNAVGKLLRINEDFQNKEILFEFAASSPVKITAFLEDFERIRPVHVKRALPVLKPIPEAILIDASVRTFGVNYPVCGKFKARGGQQGAIESGEIVVSATGSTGSANYPHTGKFKARREA